MLLVALPQMQQFAHAFSDLLHACFGSEVAASTRFHEAGHAVMAVALGIRLRRVSVRIGLYDLGRTELLDPWPHRRAGFDSRASEDVRIAEFWIFMSLAGDIAEKHYLGSHQSTSPGGRRWDVDRAWEMIDQLVDDPGERLAYRSQMRKKTRLLVTDPLRWRQITAVAERLRRHRELSGDQVSRIMKKVAGEG